MNQAMKSNFFLKAKQVKDYYRTGRDIAKANAEINQQRQYFEKMVQESKSVKAENTKVQQENQGIKLLNDKLKDAALQAKKQEELYKKLLRKGLEGKMTPEERDLILEQFRNLNQQQKKGRGMNR